MTRYVDALACCRVMLFHFVVLLMGHTFPENVRINSVLSCFLIIFLVINIKIRDINLNPVFSIYKKYFIVSGEETRYYSFPSSSYLYNSIGRYILLVGLNISVLVWNENPFLL